MEEQKENSRLESYTKTIKDVIAVFAGVGAIGYAAGFMVLSSHLMRWSITDLNLVKARYISIGFLFIIHISLIIIPGATAMKYAIRQFSGAREGHSADPSSTARRRRGSSAWIRGLLKTGYPVVIFATLSLVAAIVSSLGLLYLTYWDRWPGGGASREFWRFLTNNLCPLAIFWFVPLFTVGLLAPLIAVRIARKRRLFGLPNRVWLIPVVLILLLFGTEYYSRELYGNTANAIGGGQAFLVRMTADEKGKRLAALLGEIVCNEQYESRWVWLLDQSENSYFVLVLPQDCYGNVFDVRLDRCRTVEIPKNLVAGLIHQNPVVDKEPRCEAVRNCPKAPEQLK